MRCHFKSKFDGLFSFFKVSHKAKTDKVVGTAEFLYAETYLNNNFELKNSGKFFLGLITLKLETKPKVVFD